MDYYSIPDIPDDIPDKRELFPCSVPADGNYLPSAVSVFGYGDCNHSTEMRVRIITELALHEESYLSDKYLTREGSHIMDNMDNQKLVSMFCQYSDYYITGTRLDPQSIKDIIYRKEVTSVTEDRSFIGI